MRQFRVVTVEGLETMRRLYKEKGDQVVDVPDGFKVLDSDAKVIRWVVLRPNVIEEKTEG